MKIVHVVHFVAGFGWMVHVTPPGFALMSEAGREDYRRLYFPDSTEWHVVEKAISIRQPWGWAILEAGKRLENRSRRMAAPGWYYLHVSATCTPEEFLAAWDFIIKAAPDAPRIPNRDQLRLGGIIGIMQITGWIDRSDDPWFMGPKAAQLGVVLPVDPFVPCAGSQGVFYPKTKA